MDARDTIGINLIICERQGHFDREGFTLERDDIYVSEALAAAASCYATPKHLRPFPVRDGQAPLLWPWDKQWWRPGDRIRELQKAGALIAAELDRLSRARTNNNG